MRLKKVFLLFCIYLVPILGLPNPQEEGTKQPPAVSDISKDLVFTLVGVSGIAWLAYSINRGFADLKSSNRRLQKSNQYLLDRVSQLQQGLSNQNLFVADRHRELLDRIDGLSKELSRKDIEVASSHRQNERKFKELSNLLNELRGQMRGIGFAQFHRLSRGRLAEIAAEFNTDIRLRDCVYRILWFDAEGLSKVCIVFHVIVGSSLYSFRWRSRALVDWRTQKPFSSFAGTTGLSSPTGINLTSFQSVFSFSFF